jgi:hypothetical protein
LFLSTNLNKQGSRSQKGNQRLLNFLELNGGFVVQFLHLSE